MVESLSAICHYCELLLELVAVCQANLYLVKYLSQSFLVV